MDTPPETAILTKDITLKCFNEPDLSYKILVQNYISAGITLLIILHWNIYNSFMALPSRHCICASTYWATEWFYYWPVPAAIFLQRKAKWFTLGLFAGCFPSWKQTNRKMEEYVTGVRLPNSLIRKTSTACFFPFHCTSQCFCHSNPRSPRQCTQSVRLLKHTSFSAAATPLHNLGE